MRPWLALALLLGACKPTIPEGRAACSGDGDCPAGWYCRAAEARCYLTPGDAGVTDAGLDAGVDAATDASIDAAIDAGPGDEDCRRLAGPHARGASFDGECFVAACELGWADDDGRFENGCELDVSLPTSCGAPGVECPMGAACVSGATGAVCARVERVLAFGDTSCTVDSHGDAACWGDNDTGVLGAGLTTLAERAPQPVLLPGSVLAMDGRGRNPGSGRVGTACAVLTDGSLHCWGTDVAGGADRPRPERRIDVAVDDVAVGTAFVCVVSAGAVRCWGDDQSGQLGLPVDTSDPPRTTGPDAAATIAIGGAATAVDAGDRHACAVVGGGVTCWGAGDRGQCGGAPADAMGPTVVETEPGMPLTGVVAISLGREHSCALVEAAPGAPRRVYCWGEGLRLASGRTGPSPFAQPVLDAPSGTPLEGVAVLAAGSQHTCAALAPSGEVRCWGTLVGEGAFGDGTTETRRDDPTRMVTPDGPLGGVVSLSAGRRHTCALDVASRVFCWGEGRHEELGRDASDFAELREASRDDALVPLQPSIELEVGANHACLRGAAGSVACWGSGARGRLGTGDRSDRARPTLVAPPVGDAQPVPMAALALGQNATCGLSLEGRIFCWGANQASFLAPATADAAVPSRVGDAAGYHHLAVGQSTGCAIRDDVVECWGSNVSCAAGLVDATGACPPETSGPVPVPIEAALGIPVELGAGNAFTCARTDLGRVACWGSDVSSQLGDGDGGSDPHVPRAVRLETGGAALTGAVRLAVGRDHACARLADGTARCWGSADHGELGEGSTGSNQSVAQLVRATDGSAALGGLATLVAARDRTCGLDDSERLWCWGIVDDVDRAFPTELAAPSSWAGARIDAAQAATTLCALVPSTPTGEVVCWGPDTAILGPRAGMGPLAAPAVIFGP